MADSGVETQTIESIELNVDDSPNEDHVNIDITQVTEETHATIDSDDEFSKDEMVIITEQDFIDMTDSSKERSTEMSADRNKVYEEWIYVDVNKSTFETCQDLGKWSQPGSCSDPVDKSLYPKETREAQLLNDTSGLSDVFSILDQSCAFGLEYTNNLMVHVNLLLTEFEVSTVCYKPSFFCSVLCPKCKACSHKSKQKKQGS